MWRWQPIQVYSHSSNIAVVHTLFQSMNDGVMKNKFRIFFEGEAGYVIVDKERMSMGKAALEFHQKMLNTLKAMEDGKLSKAITITVEEIEP